MKGWLALAGVLSLSLFQASRAEPDSTITAYADDGDRAVTDLLFGVITDIVCIVSNNVISVCPKHSHCNYDTGRCVCNTGWTGDLCTVNACTPGGSIGCSGHGTCQNNHKCVCDQGWSGEDCSELSCVPALNQCVHGTCQAGDNECECTQGWKGTLCDVYDCKNAGATPCGANGVCNTTTSLCDCTAGYFGTLCNETTRPPTDCGSFGAYDQIQNVCVCKLGWSGAHCETFDCDSSDLACHEKGTCETNGTCTCDLGWSGESCFFFDCTVAGATCDVHQVCNTTTKACDCELGWGGLSCATYDCVEGGDCGEHSTCNSVTKQCECDLGWSETTPGTNPGLACDAFSCSVAGFSCGDNAECDPTTNKCKCLSGWSETTASPADGALTCDKFDCRTIPGYDCGTNSHCDATTGICHCDAGWSNTVVVGGDTSPRDVDNIDCEAFDCNTPDYDCAEHSTCDTATKQCVCDDGWEPPACTTFNCTIMTQPIDEFHQCNATSGEIVCAPERYGTDCALLNCTAVAGYDCGTNAECDADGKCACDAGWSEANATNAANLEAAFRTCTVENCTTATQACPGGKECNATTAKCECPPGTQENVTSGACEPVTCSEDPSLCTAEGYCRDDVCHCNDPQNYWDNTTAACVLGCPGIVFGACVGLNTSDCNEGWDGEKCDIFNCNLLNVTSLPPNTTCDPTTGQLVCDPGFIMLAGACKAANCTENPQMCGASATCVDGECKCTNATEYFDVEALACVLGCPTLKVENGACTGPNEADCLPGYEPATAADNTTALCDVYNCTNNTEPQPCDEGVCATATGTCDCFADSFLDPVTKKCVLGCPGMTSSHGFCTGINETHCDDGWINFNGGYCNQYDCSTLPAGTPAEEVCGGLGTCENGTCECIPTATPAQGTCVGVCPATVPGDVIGLDCNDVYIRRT